MSVAILPFLLVAGIVFLALLFAVGLPLLLIYLLIKPRGASATELTPAEVETLARLQQGIGRMEQRLANLETILADEPQSAGRP